MGEVSRASAIRQLSKLRNECDFLIGRIDRRSELLGEMKSLGGRIDQAYADFEVSARSETDKHKLTQAQAELQRQIESVRPEASAVQAECLDFHKAVGDGLVGLSHHEPAALAAAKRFRRLPTPNDSNQKLQLLQVRELLEKVLQVGPTPESPSSPVKVARAREIEGLMTAREVAELCGISDKSVYRLANEGRIPYTRIQSSLRFRRREIDRWIEAKSFQPKSVRKNKPAK